MFKDKFQFIEEVAPQSGDKWYNVPSDKIVEVCKTLRDEYKFDCLSCLTGTDKGETLEVVYHLFSYQTKETIILKVINIPRQNPAVPTISNIWPSAIWMEREIFDLLGIKFTWHPDLRRILLPDDWLGYPLRKDYKEPDEYCGMTTTRAN